MLNPYADLLDPRDSEEVDQEDVEMGLAVPPGWHHREHKSRYASLEAWRAYKSRYG